jgi:glutamate synthase domain-containing protein 1
MCGIVGLFLKNPALRVELGLHFATMLEAMGERGPDSAGIAIYHDPVPEGRCKLTLYHPDSTYDWRALAAHFASALEAGADVEIRANHAVLAVDGDETMVRAWLNVHRPDVRVIGYGRAMEVYKDMGRPAEVVTKYRVAEMEGSHALGHTRMATERSASLRT